MTTTANNLRAALKQSGFNARMVTVKERHCTLCITIRDASVSLTKVKAIVAPFERVSRDHATGEILGGGNTFTKTEYADVLVDPIKATILAVLDPALNDEYVALPGGFRAMKCTRQNSQGGSYVWEVRMKGPTFTLYNDLAVGVTWAAERLAVAYLDAAASGADGSAAADGSDGASAADGAAP